MRLETDRWARDDATPLIVTHGSLLGDRAVRGLAELSNTVTRWSRFPDGGHVASVQAPDTLVTDIREFFRGQPMMHS